ncbi:hypothetical protein LXG23DRAFT_38222 [Yarrowia lipolytica]|nr:hypothetical protein BKA91DRAFT_126298 [Yarrowia lipolytica]KAE8169278.1 hypothetical protein BKA90DRAFT_131705 [Yarrowia lipolytica]KAJ8052164.1 hypothetical protein LXG23DRAFT_38222 [Yarrowia lipolytica]RMJ00892.1 hypothetical protein BD777DRAFT_132758 [Yarrowia lipolytica]
MVLDKKVLNGDLHILFQPNKDEVEEAVEMMLQDHESLPLLTFSLKVMKSARVFSLSHLTRVVMAHLRSYSTSYSMQKQLVKIARDCQKKRPKWVANGATDNLQTFEMFRRRFYTRWTWYNRGTLVEREKVTLAA